MVVNIWRFRVKVGHEDDFLKINTHDWPDLFRKSSNYLGTEICRNIDDPHVYITRDEWTSKSSFDIFYNENRVDFDELDRKHKEYYESYEHIGFYNDL